ncbi:MAG: hypothetical protein ABIO70_23045 [Pseudomonadota bacterium]
MTHPLRNGPPWRGERGYVLLIALILMAILSVIGATSLSIAGVDQRIAAHNRKHLMIVNSADAGTVHARHLLETTDPPHEWDDSGDVYAFVEESAGEAEFGGIAYTHNLGVYRVETIYERCSNPPPGYSTEEGSQKFRSDYWRVSSTASMQDSSYTLVNETTATVMATVRKVHRGACK